MQHRLMLEQRWLTNQDFRTRVRVLHQLAFVLNTQSDFPAKLVLSNELFMNGQRDIGAESPVPIFDQNRTLLAVNKKVLDWLSVQGGVRHILSNSSNREVIDLGAIIHL